MKNNANKSEWQIGGKVVFRTDEGQEIEGEIWDVLTIAVKTGDGEIHFPIFTDEVKLQAA